LTAGGRERSYIQHVPAASDAKPRPLVIALHGGASNAAGMQRYSGLDEIGELVNWRIAGGSPSGFRLPSSVFRLPA
jgi:poly(3-hydroxybutyrate) depolymerase